MKYVIGDELYYIDPFVFQIYKIKIAFMHDEYYCDDSYAMFEEKHLFNNIHDARKEALLMLEKFYKQKIIEIKYIDPDVDIEEDILG